MEIFDEMKKFEVGRPEKDVHQFEVPLKPDDDGAIGRECSYEECQPKYFKMSNVIPDGMEEKANEFSNIEVTCPYCGLKENMQSFHTKEQIEWIYSMMHKDVAKAFQSVFSNTFKNTGLSSKGPISISFSYKPGFLPSVRHYIEEELKTTVTCDNCSFKYSVYGISFFCPLCGAGNLLEHLKTSANVIQILLSESDRITKEHGEKVGYHLRGNALEDLVSLFEGFTKQIYILKTKNTFAIGKATNKIAKVKVNFQRLEGAADFFNKDFAIDIFTFINKTERVFLENLFLKRHVITHNLGLVDSKYLSKAQAWQKQGSEIDFSKDEISRALDVVIEIITKLYQNIKI